MLSRDRVLEGVGEDNAFCKFAESGVGAEWIKARPGCLVEYACLNS